MMTSSFSPRGRQREIPSVFHPCTTLLHSTTLTMSAFTKSLKELRVHFCQTSPASNGIR